MDIFTIVKSNIKARKGQFIGLTLLVIICVASIVAFYNVLNSSEKSVNEAFDYMGVYDEGILISRRYVSDDTFDKLNDLDVVESYSGFPVLAVSDIAPVGWDYSDRSRVYSQIEILQPKPSADSGLVYPQVNESQNAIVTDDYVINPGEVYFAKNVADVVKLGIGDKVEITCGTVRREFVIAGYIEEPYGAATIGVKTILVSDEDYASFYNEVKEVYTDDVALDEFDNYCIFINKSDDAMSNGDFRKIVDDATGIYSNSEFAFEKGLISSAVGMVTMIFSITLIVVALIIYVVLLIVIGNTISSTVHDNYKEIGIFKANGFTAGKLRLVYIWQFMLIEIIGIAIGIVLGYALCGVILQAFVASAGMIYKPHFDVLVTVAIIIGILLATLLIIVLSTAKVGAVSPYKAISGTNNDVTFSKTAKVPVTKRGLSLSLATRQITSSKKSYVGLVIASVIIMVLLVFMTAANTIFGSKNAFFSMTDGAGELVVSYFEKLSDEDKQELIDLVASRAKIQDDYSMYGSYVNINNENIQAHIYATGEDVHCIAEGRAPKYDNEIAIGIGVRDSYGKDIGDTIEVSYHEQSYEYIITGIISTTNEFGKVSSLTVEAARHIGYDENWAYASHIFVLENPSNPNDYYSKDDAQAIADEINERFEDVKAKAYDLSEDDIGNIIEVVTIAVNVVTVIVIAIIIAISSSKFAQNEAKQQGVYKAMGFTSTNIRLQFAARFAIVFALGCILGGVLASLIVEPGYKAGFQFMGIAKINIDFNLSMYLVPTILAVLAAFVSAYVASRRIKKVDVNILVNE